MRTSRLSLFVVLLSLALPTVVCSAGEPIKVRRNLEWHSPSGETVALGTEIYETAPAWTRYELDMVLGDDSLRVTHSYDPWNDRHTTRLDDAASGWWVEYSTSSELSFATTAEGMRRGPLRMLEENPRIVVELETSDGWRREIAGPARMPGPAAGERLHAGAAQRAPTIPETTVRGYRLLRQAVQNAQASKVVLIEPLLEVVAPWLDEATPETSESATTLIEKPAERRGHSP